MQQTSEIQVSTNNEQNWIQKYLKIFWRWKWYIGITFPILFLSSMIVITKSNLVKPDLVSTIIIGFDIQPNVALMEDVAPNLVGKIALFQSRRFLESIVDELSLQLGSSDIPRSELFDSISVDSTAIKGKYTVSLSKDMYTITVKTVQNGDKIYLKIATGNINSLHKIRLPGITCTMAKSYVNHPYSFKFSVVDKNLAVDKLLSGIVMSSNMTRDLVKSGTIVVGVQGWDPVLITKIANTIGDKFVEKNQNFRIRRTDNALTALSKQLDEAAAQASLSDRELRNFKERNPTIGLKSEVEMVVTNNATLDANSEITKKSIDNALDIRSRLNEGLTDEQKQLSISEALVFLQDQKIAVGFALQQDYNLLYQQRLAFEVGKYGESHPQVVENLGKIDSLYHNTIRQLSSFIAKASVDKNNYSSRIDSNKKILQDLPEKQLVLAELERQQQVNAEIYAAVLRKYNQIKIADNTEISDVFVMDYASSPSQSDMMKSLLRFFVLSFIFSAGISLSPPLMSEVFNRKIRSEEDVNKYLPFTPLESIPLIHSFESEQLNRIVKIKSPSQIVTNTLITADQNGTLEDGLFRSLRTKINLYFSNVDNRTLSITSLDMGEGKSFVSSNLAVAMGQQNERTLLIDADMRRGMIHRNFALPRSPGLSDLLKIGSVDSAILDLYNQKTRINGCHLITCGSSVKNPSELLATKRFEKLMTMARDNYEMVLIDTPPLLAASDAPIISSLVGGCIIVVRAGVTNASDLMKLVDSYPGLRNKIIGVVVNRAPLSRILRRYRYSYYSSVSNT